MPHADTYSCIWEGHAFDVVVYGPGSRAPRYTGRATLSDWSGDGAPPTLHAEGAQKALVLGKLEAQARFLVDRLP